MDQTLKQPQPAIRLEDVHVTLPSRAGPVAILRGLDLNVAAGESIAVVGRSGSGKSTLLMIIAGLERATQGRVTVLGADFSEPQRGRSGAASRRQYRHRVPILPPRADHDGHRERCAAARVPRPRRCLRCRARGTCRGRPHPIARRISRASSPAASSSASPWPGRSRQSPPSSSPTSRPAISTRPPAPKSWTFCSR